MDPRWKKLGELESFPLVCGVHEHVLL